MSLSLATASTIILPVLTCPALCKHRFSLATWPVYALDSSSCWEQWVLELHCFSYAIFTDPSSVSDFI